MTTLQQLIDSVNTLNEVYFRVHNIIDRLKKDQLVKGHLDFMESFRIDVLGTTYDFRNMIDDDNEFELRFSDYHCGDQEHYSIHIPVEALICENDKWEQIIANHFATEIAFKKKQLEEEQERKAKLLDKQERNLYLRLKEKYESKNS